MQLSQGSQHLEATTAAFLIGATTTFFNQINIVRLNKKIILSMNICVILDLERILIIIVIEWIYVF